ncbi:MAG: NTPase [Candidatus Brocadiaceae bacterium]|nr:NTPase [Candidatus Brocadiaceae bacterium]
MITGRPGVGKTTLAIKVSAVSGLIPRGFYTEEIRVARDRKGFKIKTFGGREGILAHVDYKGKPRVGKYGVDVESFETIAIHEIEDALRGSQIIVIDEIGKMELFSHRFKELVIKALDSPYPLFGVIKDHGDGFIQEIKARQDVRIFTLTIENRDSILQEVLDVLKDIVGQGKGVSGKIQAI